MLVIDIETSGVDPQINSILSIGAVDFHNPTLRFYRECRAGKNAAISAIALRINGFSIYDATDESKPYPEEIVAEFLSWWQYNVPSRVIAGHNVHFDIGFLEHVCRKIGAKWPFGHRIVDIHSIVYARHLTLGIWPDFSDRKSKITLNEALRFTGLPGEPEPHNALTGALMNAECLSRLIYGKNLLPEYKDYEVPYYLLRQ